MRGSTWECTGVRRILWSTVEYPRVPRSLWTYMDYVEYHGLQGVPWSTRSTAEYRGVTWSSAEYAEYAEYS